MHQLRIHPSASANCTAVLYAEGTTTQLNRSTGAYCVFRFFIALLAVSAPQLVIAAPKIDVTANVDSGVYELGQTVAWKIQVTDNGKPLKGAISYRVAPAGLPPMASNVQEL